MDKHKDYFRFIKYLNTSYSYHDNSEMGDIYKNPETGRLFTEEEIFNKWEEDKSLSMENTIQDLQDLIDWLHERDGIQYGYPASAMPSIETVINKVIMDIISKTYWMTKDGRLLEGILKNVPKLIEKDET